MDYLGQVAVGTGGNGQGQLSTGQLPVGQAGVGGNFGGLVVVDEAAVDRMAPQAVGGLAGGVLGLVAGGVGGQVGAVGRELQQGKVGRGGGVPVGHPHHGAPAHVVVRERGQGAAGNVGQGDGDAAGQIVAVAVGTGVGGVVGVGGGDADPVHCVVTAAFGQEVAAFAGGNRRHVAQAPHFLRPLADGQAVPEDYRVLHILAALVPFQVGEVGVQTRHIPQGGPGRGVGSRLTVVGIFQAEVAAPVHVDAAVLLLGQGGQGRGGGDAPQGPGRRSHQGPARVQAAVVGVEAGPGENAVGDGGRRQQTLVEQVVQGPPLQHPQVVLGVDAADLAQFRVPFRGDANQSTVEKAAPPAKVVPPVAGSSGGPVVPDAVLRGVGVAGSPPAVQDFLAVHIAIGQIGGVEMHRTAVHFNLDEVVAAGN